jgi:hypothetical protein
MLLEVEIACELNGVDSNAFLGSAPTDDTAWAFDLSFEGIGLELSNGSWTDRTLW